MKNIKQKIAPWTFASLLFVLLLSFGVGAQAASMPGGTAPSITTAADNSIDLGIYNNNDITGRLALNNSITIDVKNLSEYLKKTGKQPNKFVLYLDWRQMKGITSRLVSGTNKLEFDIKRSDDTKDQWAALLGRPFAHEDHYSYDVPVSIGFDNEVAIPSTATASLKTVNKNGALIFLSLFILTGFIFWSLAKTTGIIRDPGEQCEGEPYHFWPFLRDLFKCTIRSCKNRTYSLGRTQMAFWFFIVAASYVFIWLVTGDADSLNSQVFILLGISGATALSADGIGKSKQTATQSSEGFLNDILSDGIGISLHRFQMVIWTFVLGIVFLVKVYDSLSMPQFSDTLLALMGISSGTYVGFKFPEK